MPFDLLALPRHTEAAFKRQHVIYNGGFDPRKRVELALRGFAQFALTTPGFQLIVLGQSNEGIRKLIEDLGIDEQVELLGMVDNARKNRLIEEASAVIYPSLFEGFGLPIIEGMAAGTPVICGSGGSQAHVAGGACHILRSADPREVAHALRIVTDKAYLKLSQARMIEQMDELLNEFEFIDVVLTEIFGASPGELR